MRKIKFNLILIAMIISLIGVGFATWSINSETNDTSTEGDFIVDNVEIIDALYEPKFDTTLKYTNKGFFSQFTYNDNTKHSICQPFFMQKKKQQNKVSRVGRYGMKIPE